MRSDLMKKGLERAPHRSLFKAMGYTDEEIARPLIGVVNSANEIIPGHIHLDLITQDVKAGIRMAGGTPVEFPVIGVCDGIAMNHAGMKYSLASRELIADSIEIMAMAHPSPSGQLAAAIKTTYCSTQISLISGNSILRPTYSTKGSTKLPKNSQSEKNLRHWSSSKNSQASQKVMKTRLTDCGSE